MLDLQVLGTVSAGESLLNTVETASIKVLEVQIRKMEAEEGQSGI